MCLVANEYEPGYGELVFGWLHFLDRITTDEQG